MLLSKKSESTCRTKYPLLSSSIFEGKVEQFWFRENMGPIFLMNVATVDEAKGILSSLPLVAEGLMTNEYMPVTPLSPLGMLIQGK
jgi:hypothetical protein